MRPLILIITIAVPFFLAGPYGKECADGMRSKPFKALTPLRCRDMVAMCVCATGPCQL